MNPWVWPPSTGSDSGGASLYATGSRPLYAVPAIRLGISDEFDSTILNAAWVTRDQTAGVIRTPVVAAFDENVVITGVATPPNISLHTQGRRSWLTMQTTQSGAPVPIYNLYKPMTWAAGRFYWTRMQRLQRRTGTTPTTGTYSLSIWGNAAGIPDNNNRVFVMWDLVNGTCRWGNVNGGVSSNVSFLYNEGFGFPGYAMITNTAGVLGASANWYGEFFTDDGQRMMPVGVGGASIPFTPAFIGWSYQNDFGVPGAMQVDFIRESNGHPLFHNA